MRKLNLILIFASLIFSANLKAQLVNNGVILSVENGGLLYVDQSYIHNNGILLNNGDVFIKNDWFNNSTTNKVFDLSSAGSVRFVGAAQRIGGSAVTQFPHLFFNGNGTLNLNRDAEARLSLNLGNREVFTEGNTLFLSHINPANLSYANGFVNTNGGGVFSRQMAKAETYYYPFGSSADNLQRPISITPKDNQPNVFNASLIIKDASLDGYSRLSKRSEVSGVNDKYYYKIAQTAGLSTADFTFFTAQKDGDYNWVTNWEENRIWQKLPMVKVQDGLSLLANYDRVLTYTSSNALSTALLPFNLANVSNASNPLDIFNAFSPDGDGKNDTWEIKNIDAFPDNEVKVYDRSGNMVYRMMGYNKFKAWDGQHIASGTYFYIIRVKINNEDKYYKGAITVVKK